MVWVKLDDAFFRNRKARAAGKDGRALFLAGLCFCGGSLSDGHITTAELPIIAAEAEVKPSVASKLVEVGMWIKVADGWTVKDYHLWNRPAANIRRERDEGRERAARSRERQRNDDGTFGRTGSERTTDQSSSSPLGVSSVNESSSSNLSMDEDDEWFTIVAKRRLAARPRHLEKVSNLRKWMRTTVADIVDEHTKAATLHLERHPEATPLEVADTVEPPTNGAPRCAPNPFADCPDCHGMSIIETDDGAVRCDHPALTA